MTMSVFPSRRRFTGLLGVSAALLTAILAAGCGNNQPAARGNKSVEVVVTTPITDTVTDYQDFTGRLSAVKTVEIRARVTGYVQEAPFKEGDVVHEGDLLFQIDPRTYQADLNQAKANLNLAAADHNLQEKNSERARRLIGSSAMAREDYETTVAAADKAKATVESMEAMRDRAKLYVDYTHVTAPLTGRISRRFVDPGNLVNADNTVLTTIVTENPLYAYFDVDERTYLDLKESAAPGQSSWFSGLHFPVLMRLANEEEFLHAGIVDFIDNQVSGTSGTIRMRGVFTNDKNSLKAGLFVRIRLPIGIPYKAFLIPDEALQSDQGRKCVYVVNDKNEVVYRTVKLGQAIHGLRVIKEGVAAGERVIVSGMQKVRPGAQVEVKMEPPPKKPDSPLGKLLTFERTPFRTDKETRRQGDKETERSGAGPSRPGG
jgi:RND family efflux transporter MFP subunit